MIELALSEFIEHHRLPKKRDLRDLVGKVSIAPDYDYKKMRIGEWTMSRYLVDTSVWIDFFSQRTTLAVDRLYQLLDTPDDYGITEFIYQEILQGALYEQDFQALGDYLVSQVFFHPKYAVETYRQAAYLYFSCLRKGITIRSTIDCLIAQIAIEHDLVLLHSDKDFIRIAECVPALKLHPV